MKVRFLGHACFLLDDGTTRILIDPFLSGNPLSAVSAEDVDADYILVTHGHGDHVGDTAAIARRTGATICCSVDLAEGLFDDPALNVVTGNMGGWMKLPFGAVKFVSAIHGSGVPGALANGFIIELDGKRVYHAGDTALHADMALLAEEAIDAALLPIGDVYTMGPTDALRAAKMISPKLVIPMHYNTFPAIEQDADAFAASVTAAGITAKVLTPGETAEV